MMAETHYLVHQQADAVNGDDYGTTNLVDTVTKCRVLRLDLDSTATLCLCRDVKGRSGIGHKFRTATGYLYKPNTTESLTGHELSGITERILMKIDAQLPLRPNRHSLRNRLEKLS